MTIKTEYQPGQFCWVDLMAKDMSGAQKFYNKLFGWNTEAIDTESSGSYLYNIFYAGDKQVAGMGQMATDMIEQGMPSVWNTYINVENINATTEKAEALGATIIMPPVNAADAGMMSMIQDPTGAYIFLWQKINHPGAQLINSPNSFCWNELATPDMEAAKNFYGELLDWKFEKADHAPAGYYSIYQNGNLSGGIMQMTDEWEGIPPHWAVYFTVENIHDSVKIIEDNGGDICVQPFEIPNIGTMSVVNDDQGGTFSLIQLSHIPD